MKIGKRFFTSSSVDRFSKYPKELVKDLIESKVEINFLKDLKAKDGAYLHTVKFPFLPTESSIAKKGTIVFL